MRRIVLCTTSRADYGIQSRLIRMLHDDADVDFSLVVSGTHLSEKHGMTVTEIKSDGIPISAQVDLDLDRPHSVAEAMALALVGFEKVIGNLHPDICVLLGDRYEMLAASLACTINNVAIAHLYGGETTEGAIDEVFRHSITKAAYLHFTSCEAYRRRVIQMGESPDRVYNVGSLGVENVRSLGLYSKDDLARDLGIEFSERNFLVTFHPATSEKGAAARQICELLSAMEALSDATIVFTHPNADCEGDVIADKIKRFVNGHAKTYLFESLGVRRYCSLAACVDAVIGNSSSGITEVPSLGTPTVNVGDRQKGRIQAASIVNCPPEKNAILSAVVHVCRREFKQQSATVASPYDKVGTASEILKHLKTDSIEGFSKKSFYDLDEYHLMMDNSGKRKTGSL